MRIVAVDDEYLQLQAVEVAIRMCEPDCELNCFEDPIDAKEFIEQNEVDVVFLDVQMPGITGVELAKQIKQIKPMVNIIFCTGYSEYAVAAMELRASGYLTKPVKMEAVKMELENLRFPVARQSEKRVRVQCFGNFEVFVDEKPVEFALERTKEVLAYLIDRRGSTCSNAEISTTLWEDDGDHVSYFQKLRNDLKDTLKAVGLEKLVVFGWGKLSLQTDLISCDYYDWLDGKVEGINAYQGEYMSQYSWAEYTNGRLFDTK